MLDDDDGTLASGHRI